MAGSLAKSGLTSLLGSSFAAGSALLLAVVVGRGFGADGAGIFFQAIGLFSVIAGVLKLGTTSGLVRSISRERALGAHARESRLIWYAMWPVLLLALGCAVTLMMLAGPLAEVLAPPGHRDIIADVLRLMAPFVVVVAVMSVLHTAARMMRGVTMFTLLQNVLVPLGRLLLVGVAAILGWSIIGAIGAWLALLPLWLLLAAGVLIQPIRADVAARSRAAQDAESFGSFWRFTGGRALGAAVEVALEWADVLVVAALRPAWEAGVYAVVTRANRAGQVADRALRVAVSPRIAHLLAREEFDEAEKLHTTATRALVLVTWPFYLTLMTMGAAVLSLFGEEFRQGATALLILSAASLVATLGGMLQSIMLMGGRSSWQVYNKSVALAMSLTLNLILVPHFGYIGAAYAFAAVVFVDTVIAGWIVHSKIGVRLHPHKLLVAAAIPLVVFGGGGIVTALVADLTWVALLGYLVVAGCLYAGIVWGCRRRLGLEHLLRSSDQSERPAGLTS